LDDLEECTDYSGTQGLVSRDKAIF
jgi:hypothetical protein